jgi:anionic cell wall polymer biosynthesis LytR-Cps2A-Psr (LCP) family protein
MAVQAPRRPATLPARQAPSTPGKTKRKRRDPLWARLTVVLGAVLMMASGAGIVGSKMLIASATGAITKDNLIAPEDGVAGKSLDGPINMLLLGVDVRPDWDINDTRADTIIILHIPASHDQAYLVSIPRDTQLTSPAFPKAQWPGGTTKATEVFFHGAQHGAGWAGGAQLMAKTIKQNTGVSFDGAAIIDFGGFKGIIEALGGVRMCVD